MRLFISISIAATLIAFPALADGDDFSKEEVYTKGETYVGQTYIKFGFGGRYFDRDVKNGFGRAIDTASNGIVAATADRRFDFGSWGYAAELAVYAPVDIELFRSNIVVFDFEGSWIDDDFNENQAAVTGAFGIPFIDGAPRAGLTGIIADVGNSFSTTVDLDYDRYSAFIGVGQKDEASSSKFGYGLYASFSLLDIDGVFQNDQLAGINTTINEEVDTFSIGPRVFAKQSFEIAPGVEFYGGGSAAILFSRGELSGQQVFNENGPFGVASLSDSETDVAFVVNAGAGLKFRPRENVLFSLFSEIEWRNDEYEVENPQYQPGEIFNTTPLTPARLEQTDSLSVTLGSKLVVVF
ncbi:MAG: hypothetical protein AAGD23_10320 [Pseudomonadota bacterium]